MRPLRLLRAVAAPMLAVLGAGLLPAAAAAQGTISAQGLGYPPGQLSTIARGSGGALGEFDPLSPLNPAAIAGIPATSVTVHYAPETRRTTLGGVGDEARVIRFPVLGAVLTVGNRAAISLTGSTLLDRTWATVREVGGGAEGDGVTESFESRGGLTDVRFAAAYDVGARLQAGVGAHLLTGVNRLTVARADPSGSDASFSQTSEVGFNGIAGSAGVVWTPLRQFSLAATGRVGGTVRAKTGDSTLATATAPPRAAASLRYNGITGAVIAVRASWEGWSSLDDLGSENLATDDALELGVGADVVGPRILNAPIGLRVGARRRDLPFGALGVQPSETAFTGGLGTVLGGGRVMIELAVERARRTAGEARETAWVLGAGVTVRP